MIDGVPRYAHNTGDVVFRRRQPLQLAATLAFVLGKKSSRFLGITPQEADAVHECLTWARDGNNRVLTFFGTVFEAFSAACGKLFGKFQSALPEGSRCARIRFTRRETRQPCEDALDSTLGEEAEGLVIVDLGGFPLKYDKVAVFSDRVARQHIRLEVDAPRGNGWQRSVCVVDPGEHPDLDDTWRQDVADGARHLLEDCAP